MPMASKSRQYPSEPRLDTMCQRGASVLTIYLLGLAHESIESTWPANISFLCLSGHTPKLLSTLVHRVQVCGVSVEEEGDEEEVLRVFPL